MENTKPPQEKVIQAFKDRNLPFKREDIEGAFKDPSAGPNNARWVQEHLGPDTLLSKEETTLSVNPSSVWRATANPPFFFPL